MKKRLDGLSDIPPFDTLIIDEAHHLKNDLTQRHKVIKKLSKNAKSIIMLTATPIQLYTKDLYNLIDILLPGTYVYNDSSAFSARLTVNDRINRAVKALNERNFEDWDTSSMN